MKYSILPLFLLLFLLVACSEKEVAPVAEAIRPVRYAKVIKTGATATNTFSGTSQSSKQANLSFKVSGTINKLKVKVGDRVRRGQVLATLDAIDYSIEYDQAVANMKNAETQIKAAQTQKVTTKSIYDRVEKLYENNTVPLSEYEEAKASYEAAESQYDAALAQMAASKKQVEGAKNQVSYARLTAPFSGVITEVSAEENELIPSGNVLAVLSAEGRPEVSVGIPESLIAQIRKGQKVDINFSVMPEKTFSGRISEVAFSSSEASTYPVIIQIDKPSKAIRPGMAANVTLSMGQSKGQAPILTAPSNAIGEGTEGNFAFVLTKAGDDVYTVKKSTVTVGQLNQKGFEIKDGLSEGQMVATAGLQTLLDGMKVKLLE